MQKVFIIEDDDNIREMVLYALSSSGFSAEGFSDGASFFAQRSLPDLLLLDIMLPERDGISILRELRQSTATKRLPVIMLTAKNSEMDKIKGLDCGADDYISKPFSVLELISRIKAVLRRTAAELEPTVFSIDGITLNSERRAVHADGSEIPLTYKEFELLRYLMENEGIVLSRDRLLDQLWGFDYGGESRTVDMHIKSLRQKLGDYGQSIKTIRNVGYKIESAH